VEGLVRTSKGRESKGNIEGETEASLASVTVPVTHAVTTAGWLPPASSGEGRALRRFGVDQGVGGRWCEAKERQGAARALL
jgi:hypothetical protein